MRRILVLATSVAALLLVPAGTASARGDGWEPLDYPAEVDGYCGSTLVHVTFPVVKEFQRFLTQPDGSVVQQITGTDYTRFTTDSGASVTVNISGPGRAITYPNGDVETVSMGRYGNGLSEEQAAQLGTPQIFTTTGLIDYITHYADGSITPVRVPSHIRDICAELGAS